jgi:hypothetical protein
MSNSALYLNSEFEIQSSEHELRMSHWILSPKIIHKFTNTVLLDLSSTVWDLYNVNEKDDKLVITLRCYPNGDHFVNIHAIKGESVLSIENTKMDADTLKKHLNHLINAV